MSAVYDIAESWHNIFGPKYTTISPAQTYIQTRNHHEGIAGPDNTREPGSVQAESNDASPRTSFLPGLIGARNLDSLCDALDSKDTSKSEEDTIVAMSWSRDTVLGEHSCLRFCISSNFYMYSET
ncbi:uncharacterized protein ARMOST_20667 [Armillaria ostoyae]|uniref:Uncharacterized protein n=1 Tax=Armillaria ostoyae TaxID=47428 RepID=A0A284S7Y3_ARMOS|nr:uncharacterized protein ARMOST_20667 [Armillaria ostoyae]